jgi:hypothetical protein
MSAFEAHAQLALSAAFRLMGADASYEPPSGPAVEGLRVIVGKADALAEIHGASFVAAQRVVEVRKSQLPSPVAKGVFVVTRKDGSTERYIIGAQPKIEDPDGLVWTCPCDPE